MVVIDHHETDDRNAILSNAATTNDASDGFETASDTDLDSDVDANDGGAIKQEEQDNLQQQHQLSDQQNEQVDPHRIISSDDASINDEELIQVLKFRVLLVVYVFVLFFLIATILFGSYFSFRIFLQ
jgi:predicted  nucleic acid-binding Zn-ribbon protein